MRRDGVSSPTANPETAAVWEQNGPPAKSGPRQCDSPSRLGAPCRPIHRQGGGSKRRGWSQLEQFGRRWIAGVMTGRWEVVNVARTRPDLLSRWVCDVPSGSFDEDYEWHESAQVGYAGQRARTR